MDYFILGVNKFGEVHFDEELKQNQKIDSLLSTSDPEKMRKFLVMYPSHDKTITGKT